MQKSIISRLIHRRVPQIIGSYIIASTSMILFIDWLRINYVFPQYYISLALFGFISIFPSVLIIAYFHGAPGKDEWNKVEKFGIPVNVVFIILVLFTGYFNDWWLYKIPEIEDYSEIYISHISSDAANEDIFKNLAKTEIQDINNVNSLSPERNQFLYDNLIQYAISKFYPTRMIYNDADIKEKYFKNGKKITLIDKKLVPMWSIAYEMTDSSVSMESNFRNIWSIKKNAKFDLGVYIHAYEMIYNNINQLFVLIDYNTNEYDGYQLKADHFVTNDENFSRDVIESISSSILKSTTQKELEAEVLEHNESEILIKYSGKTRLLKNTIMTAFRNYEVDNNSDIRIADIESFHKYCKSIKSKVDAYDYCYNIMNNKYGIYLMSYDELKDLRKGTHKFINDNNVEKNLPLNIDFKIVNVYDTTAIGIETAPSWITLNKGDILRVK